MRFGSLISSEGISRIFLGSACRIIMLYFCLCNNNQAIRFAVYHIIYNFSSYPKVCSRSYKKIESVPILHLLALCSFFVFNFFQLFPRDNISFRSNVMVRQRIISRNVFKFPSIYNSLTAYNYES